MPRCVVQLFPMVMLLVMRCQWMARGVVKLSLNMVRFIMVNFMMVRLLMMVWFMMVRLFMMVNFMMARLLMV